MKESFNTFYAVRIYHGFMGNGPYGAYKVGEDIVAGMNTQELIYTATYFSSLFGGLTGLMFYNLLAMFGLDKTISNFSRALTEWFTTPPTEEMLAEIEAADSLD